MQMQEYKKNPKKEKPINKKKVPNKKKLKK